MRAETRQEVLQRYQARLDVQSHIYWHALIKVGLATAYRRWAPDPIPTWACDWILALLHHHDIEKWNPDVCWN